MSISTSGRTVQDGQRQRWLDLVKAVAIALIFANHLAERLFGYPWVANPSAGWPPLAERIAQLRPLSGLGAWTVPANVLRYVGWAGDQGVSLFLIVSGFGLTWGLLARRAGPRLPLVDFYRRRAERVYPLWWGAHLFVIALAVLVGTAGALQPRLLAGSMLGFRATTDLFYYLSPAWWYVGLLLQLYAVYPAIWYAVKRASPARVLPVLAGLCLVLRGFGLVWLASQRPDYLDAWQRGAILVTRLPEFLAGMGLAYALHGSPERVLALVGARSTLWLAAGVYLTGILLSFTLAGMTLAPLCTGAGLFVLLMAALRRLESREHSGLRAGEWVGQHSYSLYLLHYTAIRYAVPSGLQGGAARTVAGTLVAVAASIAGAVLLEGVVFRCASVWRRWRAKLGTGHAVLRAGLGVLAIYVLLVGSEGLVRWRNPQEVLGWGERPALEPDPDLGWRLIPSQETHLRWESYDYRVSSNSLGFPGPESLEAKVAGDYRIITVGDAFTSAEGVDTTQAWPRLLEGLLADRGTQVLNLAITGYGPNQYARVLERYVPDYEPNLIIVELYVNDFDDVLWTDDAFRASIGFGLPDPNGWRAVLGLQHLRKLIRLELVEPLHELVTGRPREHGYMLSGMAFLERGNAAVSGAGRDLVSERLAEIREVGRGAGAQVLLLMVPAPVQVCSPADLDYYPRTVDPNDATRYDADQPQRAVRKLAARLELPLLDLRDPLRAMPECPYQRANMHWTALGHRVVARYVADALLARGLAGD